MKNLKDSLEKLHDELKNAKEIDPQSLLLLQNIMKDIDSILNKSGEHSREEHHNIIENLKEAAQKFEISHPEIAGSIQIVINSFSNIGV